MLTKFLLISLLATSARASKDEVQLAVRAHIGDVRVCYERALVKSPKLAGKVVMDWKIDDQGKVMSATLNRPRSTLLNPEVIGCLVEHIKTWQFPAAAAGQSISVTYPFVFTTGK